MAAFINAIGIEPLDPLALQRPYFQQHSCISKVRRISGQLKTFSHSQFFFFAVSSTGPIYVWGGLKAFQQLDSDLRNHESTDVDIQLWAMVQGPPQSLRSNTVTSIKFTYYTGCLPEALIECLELPSIMKLRLNALSLPSNHRPSWPIKAIRDLRARSPTLVEVILEGENVEEPDPTDLSWKALQHEIPSLKLYPDRPVV